MVDVVVPNFVNKAAVFGMIPFAQALRNNKELVQLRACVRFDACADKMFTQLVRAMNSHDAWDAKTDWRFETEYIVRHKQGRGETVYTSALGNTDNPVSGRTATGVTKTPIYAKQRVSVDALGVHVVVHGDLVSAERTKQACVLPHQVHLQYRRRLHIRGWCFSILRRWAAPTLAEAQRLMAAQRAPDKLVVIEKPDTARYLRGNTNEYVALSLLLKISSLLMHQTQIQSVSPT